MRAHIILVLLALFVASAASAARSNALLGGWKPIEDLKDPHVKEIAEFAVSEHNKQSKADLKFDSVVKGESQVVAGTNYRLVISVKNGKASELYQAVVWEKTWEHFLKLTSFNPVR
ncbi:hypothetical protein FNV43_RR07932 [Rhamnella rubrinervis]|uniref:Cystatin domain-containing protein n=1 Tax=Rhamnella rubrinervis TaxID=2594499 RepID=A0A8K0MMM0_9ROSA|nr:hypothetical protein FNV43_RR07932 [Rhamnella rubrinervis]